MARRDGNQKVFLVPRGGSSPLWRRVVFAVGLLAACGGADGAPPRRAALSAAELIPERKRGWEAVDDAARTATGAFADDYAAWLGDAKTTRSAVRSLVELAARHGAAPLADDTSTGDAPAAFVVVAPGGDAAAFVRVGKRPLVDGLRLVVATIDAPHLQLKQRPVRDAAGLAMLDAQPYGELDLPSWLVRPLALYVHASGAAGALDVVVGESPGDPVLVVPDLLPHLSRDVQRDAIVDSPERMNAVGAASRAALLQLLAAQGIDERAFETAEVALVPAGPPVFVGVDRALLAGHGHRHRALAYAAVRGLFHGDAPAHTAVVVVTARGEADHEGQSGTAFARAAASRIARALQPADDALAVRRMWGRSAAWVSGTMKARLAGGLALHPASADALPGAIRTALDSLAHSGAQWQFADGDASWSGASRELANLDLDAVEVAIPIDGDGMPLSLLSTLDLYQGYLACRAWLSE